ncbi:MAG: type II secretion system protein F, partial [Mesorhizobium sp.]
MLEGFSPIYAVYAAAALTGIMIAEGCYLLLADLVLRQLHAAIDR